MAWRSRRAVLVFGTGMLWFGACGGDTDALLEAPSEDGGSKGSTVRDASSSLDDASAPRDGAVTGEDGASSDAASDGPRDAMTMTGDGAADASPDSGPRDSGVPDSGVTDGGACPARPDAGTCVVPSGNFAFCGVASATSTYGGYPALRVNDGSLTTSWYADNNACPGNVCPMETIRVDVALNTPRTIGRVKILGNRDAFPTSYDVLTARIQLLAASGAVLRTEDVVASRGAEPNGDAEIFFTPIPCVEIVRVVILTGENHDPGFGEVQAFAN